jgi:hypothetical protein
LGGPETYEQHTIALIRLMIFPIVALVFLWLWSYLTQSKGRQVILKALSWILASIILMADVVLLILATYRPVIPGGPQATLFDLAISLLILASPLYVSALFCLFAVRPRMREIYKDSRFLYSFPQQILVYILAVGVYFLVTGLLEAFLGLTSI